MTATINNEIPFVPESTIDPAAGLNDALDHIDAILQVDIIAIQDAPPGAPAEGDRYIVGTGSGAWAGHDDEVARYLDATWTFHDTVVFVLNLDDNQIYVNTGGSSGWTAVATAASLAPEEQSFTDADLDTSGVLVVTHSKGHKFVVVKIFNNSDNEIGPGEVTPINTTTVNIDLSDFEPLTGTWNLVII